MVTWFISGDPQPGGSKKPITGRSKKTGKMRTFLVDDAKYNRQWRSIVAWSAAGKFKAPLEGPLALTCYFIIRRPKIHYRTGRFAGMLRSDAPYFMAHFPDATKYVRSTEDALTGIAWRDDGQVVTQFACKLYGEQPGCLISVEPVDESVLRNLPAALKPYVLPPS